MEENRQRFCSCGRLLGIFIPTEANLFDPASQVTAARHNLLDLSQFIWLGSDLLPKFKKGGFYAWSVKEITLTLNGRPTEHDVYRSSGEQLSDGVHQMTVRTIDPGNSTHRHLWFVVPLVKPSDMGLDLNGCSLEYCGNVSACGAINLVVLPDCTAAHYPLVHTQHALRIADLIVLIEVLRTTYQRQGY